MWLSNNKHCSSTNPTWLPNSNSIQKSSFQHEPVSQPLDGLLIPRHVFVELGIVLPPWLLLSWLQTNSQTKQKPLNLPLIGTQTTTIESELPLDLRKGASNMNILPNQQKLLDWQHHSIESTIPEKLTLTGTKPSRTQSVSCSTPFHIFRTFCSMTRNVKLRKTVLPEMWSKGKRPHPTGPDPVAKTALPKCWKPMRVQNKDVPPAKRAAVKRTTMTGPGKQPITRCYQCKVLFPTLFELNAHFVMEHACVLREEMERTKSWKSHAIEEFCFRDMDYSAVPRSMNINGYPCPLCNYCAKWPTELQKHIMVHSKERPHRCIICGLSYKWKWDLGRHFDKSHHKSMNPYKKNATGIGSIRSSHKRENKHRDGIQAPSLTSHHTKRMEELLNPSDISILQEGISECKAPMDWNWTNYSMHHLSTEQWNTSM